MTYEEFIKEQTEENEKKPSIIEKSFSPKIIIDFMVYQKIMYWVNKSNFEMSALGKTILLPEENAIKVIDAVLLKQKNGPTSTDIDGAAIGKAMFELRNTPGTLNWWMHSHVNMSVFWSGTDYATIKQLGGNGWFCASVFNKKNEVKSAFCQNSPVRILLEDIPTQLTPCASEELVKQWDEDYTKNVENMDISILSREFERHNSSFQETKEEAKEASKETSQANQQPKQIELFEHEGKLVDEHGNTWGVKSKKNLVPVPRRQNPNKEEVQQAVLEHLNQQEWEEFQEWQKEREEDLLDELQDEEEENEKEALRRLMTEGSLD